MMKIKEIYDPHPAEGVQKPLSSVLKYFRFITLEHCGHYPWLERESQNTFFEILKAEFNKKNIYEYCKTK